MNVCFVGVDIIQNQNEFCELANWNYFCAKTLLTPFSKKLSPKSMKLEHLFNCNNANTKSVLVHFFPKQYANLELQFTQ